MNTKGHDGSPFSFANQQGVVMQPLSAHTPQTGNNGAALSDIIALSLLMLLNISRNRRSLGP